MQWVTKMKNSGFLAPQKNYELSLIIFLDNFTRVSRSAFGFPLLIALLATRCGNLAVRSSATPSPREQVACGNCFQHFITQLSPKGPYSIRCSASCRRPPSTADWDSVDELLTAVVGIHATVPAQARTAGSLGKERVGSGVLIDSNGLIVTIGYLILEAERVEVVLPGGDLVPVKGYCQLKCIDRDLCQ